jgi:hypothetical protein
MAARLRRWEPPVRRPGSGPPHFEVRFRNLSPDQLLDAHLAFELFEQLGEHHNGSLLLINWALAGLN